MREEKGDKSGKYLPKSDKDKIKKYVQKAYDEKLLKMLEKEVQNLERFLIKSDQIIDGIRLLYSSNPKEVKSIINPIDVSNDDYIAMWNRIEFEGKSIPEYVAFYETKRGERVRSKSELNIANALYDNGIPYKYECPIRLSNGKVIYPDFTILKVNERKVVYWEHRGMMDDKEYAQNSVTRIKLYMRNGIFPGDGLILTEETSITPLGTDEIEAVIKKLLK